MADTTNETALFTALETELASVPLAEQLPELPTGYFWRIRRERRVHDGYSLTVQIRERHLLGSRTIVSETARPSEDSILTAAGFALPDFEQTLGTRMNPRYADRFVGDYAKGKRHRG